MAAPNTSLAAIIDGQVRDNGNILNVGDIVTVARTGWSDNLTSGVPVPEWEALIESVTVNTDDGDEATEQFAVAVMSLMPEPSDDEVTGEIGPALASLSGFQLNEAAQLAIDLATNTSQQAA